MGLYAEITDGTVTNVTVCDDPDFASEQGWVGLDGIDPQPGIGWSLNESGWTPPPASDPQASPSDPMIESGTLSDLVTQTTSATTVAHLREALLATLSALGADTP